MKRIRTGNWRTVRVRLRNWSFLRAFAILCFCLLFSSSCSAQASLEGEWVGGSDALNGWKFVQARFAKSNSGYEGALDVPTADAMRLPLTKIVAAQSLIRFEIATPFGVFLFDGTQNGAKISGNLTSPSGAKSKLHLIRAAPVDPKRFDQYVGVYQPQPEQSIFVTYRPFNQLAVTITEKSGDAEAVRRALMLAPAKEDVFFTSGSVVRSPDANELVTFVRNEKGEVSSLSWQQANGSKMAAPRVVATFQQEQVSFKNGEVTLGGTLLLPLTKGPHPAVVILHGSGPITRDAVTLFLRAAQFVRMGLAVFLYDKRGTGDPSGEWEASYGELADDALAGLRYLQTRKDIDPKRIGLQGNSHAGWVIPVAASRSKDLAFVIVGSGGGVSHAEAAIYEAEAYTRANKFSEEEVQEAISFTKLKWNYGLTGESWNDYQALAQKAQTRKWFGTINGPLVKDSKAWQTYRVNKEYDPVTFIEKINAPLLLLFAEPDLDRNVPVRKALAEWEKGLKKGGHKDYTIKTVPAVGHALFLGQEQGKTVLAMEAFDIIEEWLSERLQPKSSDVSVNSSQTILLMLNMPEIFRPFGT